MTRFLYNADAAHSFRHEADIVTAWKKGERESLIYLRCSSRQCLRLASLPFESLISALYCISIAACHHKPSGIHAAAATTWLFSYAQRQYIDCNFSSLSLNFSYRLSIALRFTNEAYSQDIFKLAAAYILTLDTSINAHATSLIIFRSTIIIVSFDAYLLSYCISNILYHHNNSFAIIIDFGVLKYMVHYFAVINFSIFMVVLDSRFDYRDIFSPPTALQAGVSRVIDSIIAVTAHTSMMMEEVAPDAFIIAISIFQIIKKKMIIFYIFYLY